jgi:hypothetical protein
VQNDFSFGGTSSNILASGIMKENGKIIEISCEHFIEIEMQCI